MADFVVIYGEIGLKGDNRGFFEKRLMKNIKEALKDLGKVSFERSRGRIIVSSEGEKVKVAERLSRVFGLVSFSPVEICNNDIEVIKETVGNSLSGVDFPLIKTFKVVARRADKSFPMTSPEINRSVGGYILKRFPHLKVDVHNPDLIINIEIREKTLVYSNSKKGLGGLPIGTGGKAMALLSGGIDSPVAAWMIMKRGVVVEGIYFHSFPYTGDKAKEKVIDLGRVLSKYTDAFKLHIVNFTPIQQAIGENCPDELITIIMRRMMMKIAQRVAIKRRCKALITGESVGQVASQTLESINATNAVVDIPVFRPLIGLDKLEIIERAKNIGTYETSILPYEDCCGLFVPKHPKTKPTLEEVIRGEGDYDWNELIEEAVATREMLTITNF